MYIYYNKEVYCFDIYKFRKIKVNTNILVHKLNSYRRGTRFFLSGDFLRIKSIVVRPKPTLLPLQTLEANE